MHMLPMPSSCMEFTHMEETTLLYVVVSHLPQTFFFFFASARDTDSTPGVRKMSWRRKQQPTPVFLPGKFHGQRSLVGYSPWGCKQVGHNLACTHFYFWLCWVLLLLGFFPSCSEPRLLFFAVWGLLLSVAYLVADHGLQRASVIAALRL